jgi:hypothetical protein
MLRESVGAARHHYASAHLLGLVEIVAHWMDIGTAEGEVIHPMALDGTGLEVEREVTSAAVRVNLNCRRMAASGVTDCPEQRRAAGEGDLRQRRAELEH